MPFTFTMPKLSPTMEEGTIVKWHKKEGEFVKSGELLLEIATDKATVEHSALDAGWIRKILVREGESAIVNQAIAIFTEQKEESIEGYQPEGASPSIQEVVSASEEVVLGEVAHPPSKEKEVIRGFRSPSFEPEPPLANYTFQPLWEMREGRPFASPLAKKLAKEQGIDLSTVHGSGPRGRIVSRDLALGQSASVVTFGGHREPPKFPPGSYEEKPLSPMRKVIAQRLQESKTFIPHFYCTQEVHCGSLIRLREELLTIGLKVSVNDLLLRATALALKEHPTMNSGFNSVTNSIIHFKTVDIAVAVSLSSGLITPIIRHADYKNLGQISKEMKWLATRAREGKLSREEYVGGSFTVSNLGMYGISEFVAIINPPQAAILAIAGIEEKTIIEKGEVVIGKVMRLTVSADHRVLDGADVAQFLKTLQKFLEKPSILLL